MKTIKTYKKIVSNELFIDGLDKHKGKTAEIIILIEDSPVRDNMTACDTAFSIIKSCAGPVDRWTRDELHER